MYTVALVQNQSEMSHYACADARALVEECGYDCRLFTGDEIGSLATAIQRRQVHAVMLGSNGLNDRNILREVCTSDFAAMIGAFLETGRGFLSFQQIGLAMRRGPTMNCLPEPYGRLLPTVPPADDAALTSGGLDLGATTAPHVAMAYPNPVDLDEVRCRALAFRGYQGLYRHYWDAVDLSDWDQLVVDPTGTAIRSLVLASKESSPGRIVVSALPLDWQKHVAFFRNLLVYVVEGHHHLATVALGGDRTFDYLRASLRARSMPFGQYTLPDDLNEAVRNVEAAVHRTLLVGAGLRAHELPDPLRERIETAVLDGQLRLVDVGAGSFGVWGLNIVSRELRPRRLLVAAEMQMQTDLRSGYIDDSFWSHVETLQTIERMPDRVVRYGELQEAAFEIAKNHDRSGSYDELFGPTCAYYWLRATYPSAGLVGARQTAGWLRHRLAGQDPQDRALAYLTFASLGELRPEERDDLAAVAAGMDPESRSESQLLLVLRAVMAAGLPHDVVAPLAEALVSGQDGDMWMDLTTTATAANILLDVRQLLDDAERYPALVASIDDAVRAAVVVILRELAQAERAAEPSPYPWEGKARTTTKCLQAWLKFDARQDLPVHELIENLARADLEAAHFASGNTALATLQDIGQVNRRLRSELAGANSVVTRLSSVQRKVVVAGLLVVLVVYALLTLVVGLVLGPSSLIDGIKTGVVNGWGFHFGLIGVVVGVVGFVQALRKRGASSGGETDKRKS